MTDDNPDYWNSSKVDITAQTITSMAVDIVAQTLTKLNVDITAQTISQLVVDIAAQSLGNLAVDLNAQSIGNIAIDIAAQAIGNIEIDIAAQALGEVINRPTYGGVIEGSYSAVVPVSTKSTLLSVSGTGLIYGGSIMTSATQSHKNDLVFITIDGNAFVADNWNTWRINTAYAKDHPIFSVTYYDDINFYYGGRWGHNITFESSIVIEYFNVHATNTIIVTGELIYATI